FLGIDYKLPQFFIFELEGEYQKENIQTILLSLKRLKELNYRISQRDILHGLANVQELTGLMGRWQKLSDAPTLVCDTGHNVDGMNWNIEHLAYVTSYDARIVLGMVSDKDVRGVLELLPRGYLNNSDRSHVTYYFTQAGVKRAMPADELLRLAQEVGLEGTAYPTVVEAVQAALKDCPPEDFIFVGGSTFVVADLLANRDALNLH
ncbi:MAG: bifunctional folylpolyglutamate synthase/dihydrofolate synthase, partial [Mediterranea sp.]|nr:bifunctional folylpolyglutamate synthase/dihydrofolate synthase [Mediterranea sp.]